MSKGTPNQHMQRSKNILKTIVTSWLKCRRLLTIYKNSPWWQGRTYYLWVIGCSKQGSKDVQGYCFERLPSSGFSFWSPFVLRKRCIFYTIAPHWCGRCPSRIAPSLYCVLNTPKQPLLGLLCIFFKTSDILGSGRSSCTLRVLLSLLSHLL